MVFPMQCVKERESNFLSVYHKRIGKERLLKKERAKNISHRKLKKLLKILALVLLSTLSIGFCYEQISEYIDSKTIKVPGQMVQVGNHKMHIYCTGINREGSPTVILIPGGRQIYSTWIRVQPEISKLTRVCSYDRSGLGFSEPNVDIKTNVDVADELHQLLKNAGVSGPYIIVGHSLGGFYARVFAKKYSEEVKGLVLVDSNLDVQQDMEKKFRKQKRPFWLRAKTQMMGKLMEWSQYVGFKRIMMQCYPGFFGVASEDKVGRAINSLPSNIQSKYNSELKTDYTYLKESNNFGDLPLRVLYADRSAKRMDPYLENKAEEFQRNQVHMSTNSKVVRVENSGHFIQIDHPRIVIEQIKEILKNQLSNP
jgi:pimeloyl-ACP methyl ester carboxylesterase